ncbi:Hypothetical predicted protein [Mytilus galloprovincialis]|uniref:Peptidase S1 domain-containing protein n=1 Tax=Mytilus galloprovincialis TaxID=29158 RepID=A0A8B6FLX5_MYTGA|nr:Hypothetical predicted protein [Mytilus galloprovincialis]
MWHWLYIVLAISLSEGILAQNGTCGVQVIKPHQHSSTSRVSRIVGGRESIPHSWPWMVLLRFRTATITCGGSLVRGADGNIVIVTAAHCVDGATDPADWKADVGVHSRASMEPNQKEYGIQEIIPNPGFNFQFLDDDIAILKTAWPIELNDYVQPICMTTENSELKVGQECVVMGWGADVQGGSPVDRLHEVYKPIIADVDCGNALSVFGYNNNSMLCAGNLVQGGVDACSFDSGVPFACKNTNGQWELVGISSWGFGCAQPGYPGVYTEVYTFLQWIHDNTHTSAGGPVVG